jgi:hypothetical protein
MNPFPFLKYRKIDVHYTLIFRPLMDNPRYFFSSRAVMAAVEVLGCETKTINGIQWTVNQGGAPLTFLSK